MTIRNSVTHVWGLCLYAHAHTYRHMWGLYVHTWTQLYTHMWGFCGVKSLHVCVYLCSCVYVHHTHTHAPPYVTILSTYAHTYTHIWRLCVHMHTHTCAHTSKLWIRTHTHTHAHVWGFWALLIRSRCVAEIWNIRSCVSVTHVSPAVKCVESCLCASVLWGLRFSV